MSPWILRAPSGRMRLLALGCLWWTALAVGQAAADQEILRVDLPGSFGMALNHWALGHPSGHFMIGYQVATLGGSGASVSRLDSTAQVTSTTSLSGGGDASAAAYDPFLDEFLVVFERVDPSIGGDPPDVAGRYLDDAGAPIWIEFDVMEKPLLSTDSPSQLQVAFNSFTREYLVSALVDAGGGLGEVWVRGFDSISGFPLGQGTRIVGPITLLRSQSLVFVPVADSYRPYGWYLLAINRGNDVSLYMLDRDGQIVPAVWDCNHVPPLPVRTEIPVDLGTVDHQSYHADAAYGVVDGEKRLMVVWEDLNNTWNGYPAAAIWGTYLDASITRYCGQAPDFQARWIGATNWHNFYWWTPQVAHVPGEEDFLVVWRELSADNPANDVIQEHIRAQWVEEPGPNFVLSQATGPYPGLERPRRPAIGVASSGHWLVTWDDQRANTSSSGRAIYGAHGWHPAATIFADDFETGDVTRWSKQVP